MKNCLHLALLTAAMFTATRVTAAVVPETISTNWTGAQDIPDNNASGVAFSFYLNPPAPEIINGVTVNLNLAGGWNGDLYAYLSHGSGFSVLLNRPGRTSGNPGGSGGSGLNVELADSHLTDIHTAAANPLTGNFAPDGRNVNPFNALDTDPRNALLGSFTGLNPSGLWTLFFADLSPLSVSTIQSWTVTVSATPVPEPGSAALLVLAALLGRAKNILKQR